MKKASLFAIFDQKTTFLEFLTGQKRPQHFSINHRTLFSYLKSELKSTEVMQMLQNVRTHLQTEPGVKSEWLNGLESVLIQKIENE